MRVCSYCHLVRTEPNATCALGQVATEVSAGAVPEVLHGAYSDFVPYARGGTGTCYQVTQKASGFRGLLKLVDVSPQGGSERVRLKRELRKQTKLTDANLVRIIDGGETGTRLWLFRDFVPGESLAVALKRRGPLPLPEALAITAQVATALDELHRGGLLHRDVKPGHIILCPQQEASADEAEPVPLVKVIDAGITARLSTGSVFDMLGTPAYMSPEQINGKLVSFRSDLYSLGCVLYEMLHGASPFARDDTHSVLEAHKEEAPAELEIEMPAQLRSLLGALLAKEPRKRPFSAQQVRRTLDPFLPPGTPRPRSTTRAALGGPRPPAAPTSGRPAAPPPPAPGFTGGDNTEEIDLEELAIEPEAEQAGFGAPRSTVNLTSEEVDELAVSDSEAPAASRGDEHTMHLDSAEVDALAIAPEEEAYAGSEAPPDARGSGASAGREAPAAPDPGAVVAVEEPAAELEREGESLAPAEPSVGSPDDAAASGAHPRSAAGVDADEGGEPAPSARSGARPAVDFDVESLFDDDVAEPAQRTTAEAAAASGAAAAAPSAAIAETAASAGQSTNQSMGQDEDQLPTTLYRPEEVPAPDTEGTVVVARPAGGGKRLPLPWLAVGAVVAVLVAWILFSGDEREPASRAVGEGAATQSEGATASAAAQPRAAAERTTGRAPAEAVPPMGEPAAPEEAAAEEESAQDEAADGPEAEAAEPEEQGPTEGGDKAEPGPEPASGQSPVAEAEAEAAEAEEASAEDGAGEAQGARGGAARASREERLKRAESLKAEGRAHYSAGRFREAARAYEKATVLVPTDAGAFAGLGASHLAAGNAARAVRAYQRTVRLQPKSANFHAALGRALVSKGDRARAKAAYERALELNPNHGAAKAALARLK